MTWVSTARLQGGLIARVQLLADGMPPSTVDSWLHTGRLEATRSLGVYRVAGSASTDRSAAWFAALATRSPLSYLSAALWWDMPVEDDGLVHITRFDRRRLTWPAGVRVHRVALERGDIVKERGLWVTTRVVTALDCIGWLPPGRAITLADRAVQQSWLHPTDIQRRLDESPGRWGNRQLRRIGATLKKGADAESERRLHRLMRGAGIVGWVAQHHVATTAGRVRVDIAFPELRLAIEVDGYAYHSRDERFQRDRTKQNALIAAGWRVLRFTWADIVDRPQQVLAQISALVAA